MKAYILERVSWYAECRLQLFPSNLLQLIVAPGGSVAELEMVPFSVSLFLVFHPKLAQLMLNFSLIFPKSGPP